MRPSERSIHIPALRELLDLDPNTGLLTWRPREVGAFAPTTTRAARHTAGYWNSRYAGKQALASPHVNGYLHGRIWNAGFLAHRVVWALHYGAWPDAGVDHINGVKTDNRICNLRLAGHSENARNMKRLSTNRTGVTGVSKLRRNGKFYASIGVGGKTLNLGTFARCEDAIAARLAANEKYGFHENHGRAA